MSKIQAIIVDDEPPAREIIRHYLSDVADIELIGECENGFEAIKMITDTNPQLIFLDVQMPKVSGFELLEIIQEPPHIIFTTAYDEFAIKAFEMNAVDYLLKPFSRARFIKAVERVRERVGETLPSGNRHLESLKTRMDESSGMIDRVVVRIGNRIVVVPVDKIWYIEAQDDYVMIYSEMGNHLKEKTMKYFEAHLSLKGFIRIHRSYLVNVTQIQSVELYEKDSHLVILKCGAKLKASAEGYKRLREML